MLAVDDLPSLALFARVVHHRSFSAAAREAGIRVSHVDRRGFAPSQDLADAQGLQRDPERVIAPGHQEQILGSHCTELEGYRSGSSCDEDLRSGAPGFSSTATGVSIASVPERTRTRRGLPTGTARQRVRSPGLRRRNMADGTSSADHTASGRQARFV